MEDVNEKIDASIARMAEQAKAQVDSQRALHFSQAALNLSQAKAVLQGINVSMLAKKAG